jgi:hypothetical protein
MLNILNIESKFQSKQANLKFQTGFMREIKEKSTTSSILQV